VELELSTDRAAALVVRQAHAAGWRAWLDGVRVPVQQAGERHLGIAVPEGRHHVRLAYRPPGLAAGLTVAAAALVTLAVLVWPVRFGPLSPRAPD
jgi:uncharacterized membrane protein YfhO